MSGAQVHLDAHGTFSNDPTYTLFGTKYEERDVYVAQTYEVPFDNPNPTFGSTASCTIPPKADLIRRVTLRSELPELYTPLGPGYVYSKYSDQVDGNVFVLTNTQAIQPGDFVGYFSTQFINYWATNFVGYANISVAYDSTLNKFVFTSVYSNLYFQNENSASFWGFDIRNPDFFTSAGYFGYNFTNSKLVAPLTLVQAGWIRGFTPPPPTGFSYKDSVACRLVKEARLLIGGQTIDRVTAERLIIEDDLYVPYENKAGLTILEGKNDTAAVYTPREYYTRLTFNTDTINISDLYRQDVLVEVDLEKFENLPENLITTNGFLDGNAWVVSNIAQITGYSGIFDPDWVTGYKNYVIIGKLGNSTFKIYNEFTQTFYTWTPNFGSSIRVIVVGNTIYGANGLYLIKADLTTVLNNPTTPWTQSTYSYFTGAPQTPYGEGKNTIATVLADARYLYLYTPCNYYTIYGYRTAISSGSLAGDNHTWTVNIIVYGITPPFTATMNAAFETLFSTYTSGPYTGSSNTQTVYNTTNTMYSWSAYFTNVQTPGNENIPFQFLWGNLVYIRYDSYSDFNSSSSYSWTPTPQSNPLSFKDALPGAFETNGLPNNTYIFFPTFDGRYIYTGTAYPNSIVKFDTQNFFSNTYVRATSSQISPFPIGNIISRPLISDGRYTYGGSIYDSGNWYFTRYDNTKDITLQTSWEYYLDQSGFVRSWEFEFHIPVGFDGKYIYFTSVDTQGNPALRFFSLYSYNTTLPFTSSSAWKWLDFKRDGTVNASDGSHPIINVIIPANQGSLYSDPGLPRFVTGSRYLFLVQTDGRQDWNHPNFIQFNPLTMSGSLATSMLVKYEQYTEKPKAPLSLYGQTYLNEFTLVTGRQFDFFTLRFVNPVREIWVTVPAAVSRMVLRLNNEILVDDDQVTAQYIRPFETHTAMPTSGNVYVFSMALNPEKLSDPSGTVNASRIATPTLEVYLTSPATTNLTVRVYAKVYNVLESYAGIGGLVFNSAY